MFTGLIADTGRVESIEAGEAGARLRIATSLAGEIAAGDSVAVGGACLTAAAVNGGAFAADVVNQTLELTTLGGLVAGDAVNLELALRAADRLGGHIVQGHVDGVGAVSSLAEDGIARRLEIAAPSELAPLLAERGSIAVDGVSLTLVDVAPGGFSVMLIPHTLAVTTLGALRPGDRGNIEADMLAKHVRKLLESEHIHRGTQKDADEKK